MKREIKTNVIPKSRIPIAYLIDYIKDGLTISDFMSSYPWLKRKQIEQALEEIKQRDFTAKNVI